MSITYNHLNHPKLITIAQDEDGHVGGLRHPDKTNVSNLSRQVKKDGDNLMQNHVTGTNLLPAQ